LIKKMLGKENPNSQVCEKIKNGGRETGGEGGGRV